ncbi:PREDICTED: protein FAM110C [Bison bison bison]|uniref:Protein FAM110C n=1 Tax=Bison bison bison TaxID=43346 RepID=A0A6P3I515_BISBB|nr:PREDICTED: protein FAM110C [Bison bison bison]
MSLLRPTLYSHVKTVKCRRRRRPRPAAGRGGGPPGPHRLGPSPPLCLAGPRGSALTPEQVRAKPGGTLNRRAGRARGEGGPGGRAGRRYFSPSGLCPRPGGRHRGAAAHTEPTPELGPGCAPRRGAAGGEARGLQRSQSDLSSRYSASLAESDTFFQYCGLEPDVVEALGRENFSAESDRGALKVRSVSVATSDSGFSRRSGEDEGLQEEELAEQVPSTTSVVERNARIIKWLYTCKKAKETPGQGLQGPA